MNLASKPLHVERRSKRIPRVEDGSRVIAAITGRRWSTAIKVSKHGAIVADHVHRYIGDEDTDLVNLVSDPARPPVSYTGVDSESAFTCLRSASR